MNDNGFYIHLSNPDSESENEPWKELDQVIRKWASLSRFEKDQSDYQKMKELYQ